MARPYSNNLLQKSKPGIAFMLSFHPTIHLSLPMEMQHKLKEKYPNVSKVLREKFLDSFQVKTEVELLSKYPNVRKKVREFIISLKEEIGVDDREFSKIARKWAEELLEN